jgi:carbamoyl-phosphate synthase large subunit
MIIEAGIPAKRIKKIFEGRPDIVDAITNGEIDLIVDTPTTKKDDVSDSYIRKNAIKHHIPYITTMAAARASAEGIGAEKLGEGVPVRLLQEYHASIEAL